jgi:hypothetical protein
MNIYICCMRHKLHFDSLRGRKELPLAEAGPQMHSFRQLVVVKLM